MFSVVTNISFSFQRVFVFVCLLIFQIHYIIKFGQTYLSRPSFPEKDGTTKFLWPNEARLRSLTYASGLWVDIEKQTAIRGEINPSLTDCQKRVPIGTVNITFIHSLHSHSISFNLILSTLTHSHSISFSPLSLNLIQSHSYSHSLLVSVSHSD